MPAVSATAFAQQPALEEVVAAAAAVAVEEEEQTAPVVKYAKICTISASKKWLSKKELTYCHDGWQ